MGTGIFDSEVMAAIVGGLLGGTVTAVIGLVMFLMRWPAERKSISAATSQIALNMATNVMKTMEADYKRQGESLKAMELKMNEMCMRYEAAIWVMELQIIALGGEPLITSDGLMDLPAKELDGLVDRMKIKYRRFDENAQVVLDEFSIAVERFIINNNKDDKDKE